jgi:hypothetical protein
MNNQVKYVPKHRVVPVTISFIHPTTSIPGVLLEWILAKVHQHLQKLYYSRGVIQHAQEKSKYCHYIVRKQNRHSLFRDEFLHIEILLHHTALYAKTDCVTSRCAKNSNTVTVVGNKLRLEL